LTIKAEIGYKPKYSFERRVPVIAIAMLAIEGLNPTSKSNR